LTFSLSLFFFDGYLIVTLMQAGMAFGDIVTLFRAVVVLAFVPGVILLAKD